MQVENQLPIMEHFYTVQGEGAHSGTAAYFVRLAGCDVGCHWCDVKESWEIQKDQYQTINSLLEAINKHASKTVVITGGEPTTYDLNSFTASLKEEDFQIHIETSGVYQIKGQIDWITLSPKKFKPCLPENFKKADELKVVVFHPSDLKWAEELAQNVRKDCKLYLQPEWGKRETIAPLIIEYIQSNPKWKISIQSHKYLNIP